MRFFPGLHHPADSKHFEDAFISVNTLRRRKGSFPARNWIMDSGAFTEISTHGCYRHSVKEYADEIKRWARTGNLLAAVSQDYMCEAHILAKTGLTIADHQKRTIDRYDDMLWEEPGVYIMPVLQGYAPEDYVSHIRQYGDRLKHGAWIGVGSVCKRNGSPEAIEAVLLAIHMERPDLLLHGFGIKFTALKSALVQVLLHTSDSMAWSFAARKQGRDANDWREAVAYCDRIAAIKTTISKLCLKFIDHYFEVGGVTT